MKNEKVSKHEAERKAGERKEKMESNEARKADKVKKCHIKYTLEIGKSRIKKNSSSF